MVIAGLDLETTGLSYEAGHRIIEVGIIKYNFDGVTATKIGSYIRRIHPNRSIPADATAVHGISLNDLIGCSTFDAHAGEIQAFLSDVDLLVGHNLIGFDAPFLAFEMMAAGVAPRSDLQCADTIDARWATPNGKLPNLGELCYALDIKYDPSAAHSAEYDIDRTMDCFFKGLNLGFFKIPESVNVSA